LIPLLYVYVHIKDIVINTVKVNGIFHESNTANCNTDAIKYNLNEAPIVLDNKKKEDPVL